MCRHDRRMTILVLAALAPLSQSLRGGPDGPPPEELRQAAERGLRLVEKAARKYPEHRSCFSCHHQTLPALAVATARDHGLPADEAVLAEQAEFSHGSFESRARRMLEGEGVGGTSMTVGYGLWMLDIARARPDDTTAAMVTFLLKHQKPDGSWERFTSRPPLEDSNLTCTVLAARFLPRYAAAEQRAAADAAVSRARAWLLAATPGEAQEDRNAWLGGLQLLGAPPGLLASARSRVLAAQREDGGWAQLPGMESDAYATGQTLFVLGQAGLAPSAPVYRRGLAFLLAAQREDGSWLVESRSKPIQTFFDNGDPHGKDQFISIAATSWATTALALALPPGRVRRL
jgi:N-acyl-D-amino-acid deacylase